MLAQETAGGGLFDCDEFCDQVEHVIIAATVFFNRMKPMVELSHFLLEVIFFQGLSGNGSQVERIAVLARLQVGFIVVSPLVDSWYLRYQEYLGLSNYKI